MKENKPQEQSIDLTQLSRELESRAGKRRHITTTRMIAWTVTVAISYKIKRLCDLVFSIIGLLLLSPLFLFISLCIKLTSPGSIIFTQIRVGRYGRHFKFYKFRSMYVDAERRKEQLMDKNESADGVLFKMKDDPRVTPFGRIIRKTSLDELPQLFNVLLGDMSLVGPRPPLPEEVRQYTLEDRKRLNVIPGISCIWQISGRSDIPFNEQVQMDKKYIASRGFWTDVLILLKTIPVIFTGKGAY